MWDRGLVRRVVEENTRLDIYRRLSDFLKIVKSENVFCMIFDPHISATFSIILKNPQFFLAAGQQLSLEGVN